jgi:hypothetical protein
MQIRRNEHAGSKCEVKIHMKFIGKPEKKMGNLGKE